MKTMPDDIDIARRLSDTRAAVMATIPTVRSSRFSRRTKVGAIVSGAAIATLALTGGAVAVVQATPEEVSYSVQCFAGPSLNSANTTIGHPQGQTSDGALLDRQRTDPVADCAFAWKAGLIGQKATPVDPNAANFPVPALVGCTLANGVPAGFPRGDSKLSDAAFCDTLGLAAWRG